MFYIFYIFCDKGTYGYTNFIYYFTYLPNKSINKNNNISI